MGFGNPAAERAALEATYEDTATVTRVMPVTGPDNITRNVPAVVHQDVICGLSQAGVGGSGQTPEQNRVECDAVLFLPPGLLVKPGDEVTVRRFGRDDPGSTLVLHFDAVGRPACFATHQEVTLKDRDMA